MKKILLIVLAIIVVCGLYIILRNNMSSNNLDNNTNSYAPAYDNSSKLGTFNYPGTSFVFSYPLTSEKGASTAELQKNQVYQINISGGDSLKVLIMNKPQGFVRVATNPNKVEYRKFIDDDKLAHIIFYGYGPDNNVVEIILNVADQVVYSDAIISSFKFTNEVNPIVDE